MSAATPVQYRPRPIVQEREILRVAAYLSGDNPAQSAAQARKEILIWAEKRTAGKLPPAAWGYEPFDHMAGGRNCSAIRFAPEREDIWALRVEDPDKNVAGRIWTTEASVSVESGSAKFSLRLLVSSPEKWLDVEPAVPGVVRQLIKNPGLAAGNFKKLPSTPIVIKYKEQLDLLVNGLLDPERRLPVIALSVSSESSAPHIPPFDAKELAMACAGLALVVVVPAEHTWNLTYRLGKRLSVFEGAARVYLPGFAADDNPFGAHELVLPKEKTGNAEGLKRLRWIAANGSVRRLLLGADVLSFAQLRLRWLEERQRELNRSLGQEDELTAARKQMALLQERLDAELKYQQMFSDSLAQAEERAETAEAQARAYGFRIQQLRAELEAAGARPDQRTTLPNAWSEFADWFDEQLAGRVQLTPQARDQIRKAEFEDVALAAQCLLWLANQYREARLEGAGTTVNEMSVEAGVRNSHCGSDVFEIDWQGKTRRVEWHIKNGGNTREPRRCLRIYHFWDDQSQQPVVASMPAHRRTDAS